MFFKPNFSTFFRNVAENNKVCLSGLIWPKIDRISKNNKNNIVKNKVLILNKYFLILCYVVQNPLQTFCLLHPTQQMNIVPY